MNKEVNNNNKKIKKSEIKTKIISSARLIIFEANQMNTKIYGKDLGG